jgi:Zn-finger nucleic acid-binding protein
MKCPTCDVALDRAEYENVSVSQCPQCKGYLVNRNRVVLIKTTQDHSPETLRSEMTTQCHPDAQSNIRCPKCRGRMMSKERVPVKTDSDFFLDVCRECNVVWFDGGELARLQIQYESSMKALEAYSFQQKARHRTEEDEEEFQQNLAALPIEKNWIITALSERGLDIIVMVPIVVTGILFYSSYPNWVVALASLVCALCLALSCVKFIRGGILRITSVIAVIAVEVIFLSYIFNHRLSL